jgi:hypothetical protein
MRNIQYFNLSPWYGLNYKIEIKNNFTTIIIFQINENEISYEYFIKIFKIINSIKGKEKKCLTNLFTEDKYLIGIGKSFTITSTSNAHEYANYIMNVINKLKEKAYPINKSGSLIIKIYIIEKEKDDK